MTEEQILYKTQSVCPVCLKKIPARRVRIKNEVFIRKTCSLHGDFESIIWRGFSEFNDWLRETDNIPAESNNCPDGCGLCDDHLQETCCLLLNITERCNLNCSFCLADQCNDKEDIPFEEICTSLDKIIVKGKSLIQLSGGEPTMRKDLAEIIRYAKNAGAKYIQLNSNGVCLGEDADYVKTLADAGLSFVFMQFDGTEDKIFERLRNKPLLKIKQQAINNCAKHNIGVTLVPTLVRGVNLHNIGDIIRFAVSQSPKVRGVHFQPASYFGRIPRLPENKDRITPDELVFEIEKQSGGIIKASDLTPSSCYHSLCSFHGDFRAVENKIEALYKQRKTENNGCCSVPESEKNREFIGRRWQRPLLEHKAAGSCCGSKLDIDSFLRIIKQQSFTITAKFFQDAGNIDFSRLRKCSFHVYENEKYIPFCSYFLSAWK